MSIVERVKNHIETSGRIVEAELSLRAAGNDEEADRLQELGDEAMQEIALDPSADVTQAAIDIAAILVKAGH